jgi:hypothetical protein
LLDIVLVDICKTLITSTSINGCESLPSRTGENVGEEYLKTRGQGVFLELKEEEVTGG